MSETLNLHDLNITYSVGCDKCQKEASDHDATSPYQARERFQREGWGLIDGEVVCPACSKSPTVEPKEQNN